jgi:hypothetical protein
VVDEVVETIFDEVVLKETALLLAAVDDRLLDDD